MYKARTDMDPEEQKMIGDNSPQATQIDPKRARFPFCVVWSPLPVLVWLIPFIGHIGICREDGVILDFAGPNYICVDNFAFGSPTRYLKLDEQGDASKLDEKINHIRSTEVFLEVGPLVALNSSKLLS